MANLPNSTHTLTGSGALETPEDEHSEKDGDALLATRTYDANNDPSLITAAPDSTIAGLNDALGDIIPCQTPLSALADVQNAGALKRTYLSLLPTKQLIDLLLSFDSRTPADTTKDLWPSDLKEAVSAAAVAAIVGQGAKDKALEALRVLGIDNTSEAGTDAKGIPTMTSPTAIQTEAAPPLSHVATGMSPLNATLDKSPFVVPAPTLGTFEVPPQQSAFNSAFVSGSFSYQQSMFTPQFYEPPASSPCSGPSRPPEFSPTPQGIPLSNIPPPPPPLGFVPGGPDEDEDLPSYEDMIVQAIVIHNDLAGTAPKQIFQWMASTYPLQTNFRPSASQALQKAFKRGRLEKSPEGRYRLSVAWSGGSTAKRVTRRPQTYSRSVTNPSPSSHPAANVHHFPPHHFTFHYGPGGMRTMGSSPVPPSSIMVAPPPDRMADEGDVSAQVQDTELKDSMEKVINILQALTATPPEHDDTAPAQQAQHSTEDQSHTDTVESMAPDTLQRATKGASKGKRKGGKGGKEGKKTVTIVPPPIFAAESRMPTPPPTAASQSIDTNPGREESRALLQGALAILATQLTSVSAEISGSQMFTENDEATAQ